MTDPMLDRQVRRRLAILRHADEVTGNVGDDLSVFWHQPAVVLPVATPLRRAGADGLRDRSRRPHFSPNATHDRGRREDHLPAAALPLRAGQDRDVPQAVPRRRRSPLRRVADPQAPRAEPAAGLQRDKRHTQRWKRYEKQLPGHRVQIDVKFIEPMPGSTPQEGTTSSPRSTTAPACGCCGSTPACNQKTAIQFLDYVLSRLPFRVEIIQTDNGAEFQSAFHYHALDQGIGHVYLKPRTPGSTARSVKTCPRRCTGAGLTPAKV